ncbi:MAG: ABC transporter ATP-binding protein [Bacteroidota bacterium]
MNAVEINNLQFVYGNNKFPFSFELNVADWKIPKGEFVCLLGANGSGKSTLLKLIAGLLSFKTGSIKINENYTLSMSRKELAKKVAYVPQKNFSFFPFSVYEIVMMGRTPYLNMMGFENSLDRQIVEEALATMQVERLKQKGINEISGGEAQRVFIARALAQKAEIILLDEPNAHLDLEHQIMIFDFLKKLNSEQKITVLAVSHDLNLVGIFSKKVALMNEGSIILEGDKSEVLNEKNIAEVFKINSAVFPSQDSKSLNVLVNPVAQLTKTELH